MSNRKYWKTSLEELLSEHNIEITEQLIDDILSIAEMESEACGYYAIPNPLKSDIESLNHRLEKQEESHRKQIEGIRKGVAQRRGCPVENVLIDADGYVEYKY